MSARESIIPVFVPHLGCPNDCVFCNQRRISGSLTPACPEDVIRAIESAGEGTSQLAFYGGSFTAIPDAEQEALLGAAPCGARAGRRAGVPDGDREGHDALRPVARGAV